MYFPLLNIYVPFKFIRETLTSTIHGTTQRKSAIGLTVTSLPGAAPWAEEEGASSCLQRNLHSMFSSHYLTMSYLNLCFSAVCRNNNKIPPLRSLLLCLAVLIHLTCFCSTRESSQPVKTTHLMKVLATKSENVSSILRTHMVEQSLTSYPPLHLCYGMCPFSKWRINTWM